MLTLKTLTFQNIGRFVEPQTIDFTQLSSLSQLEGVNKNTDGSSGAGKSTVFKALDWLLGLDGPATTVLQSRLTKDAIQVSATFDFDGQPLLIERGKKLLIDLNHTVVTGSSKITEEELDLILGMPRDIFRKVLHKRQGEGGWFLDLGPSKTHQFLTNCLKLQKEQQKILKLDLSLTDLEKQEVILKTKIESSKTGLEATQNAISSLGSAPVSVYDPSLLENLKQNLFTATEKYKFARETLKSQMDEFEKTRPQISITPYDRSKINDLELRVTDLNNQMSVLEKAESNRQSEVKSKISELKVKVSNLNNEEVTRQSQIKNEISSIQLEISKLQSIEYTRQSTVKSSMSDLHMALIKNESLVSQGNKAKEEALNLSKELKKVRAAVCPTCEQGWVNDTCKAKEAQLLSKLSEYKKAVVAGTEASKNIVNINEQLILLKEEVKPKPVEIDSLNNKIFFLKEEAKPKTNPELLTLSKNIQVLEGEAKPKLIIEAVELSKMKFLSEQMLGFERKEELDHQFKEKLKSQAILDQFAKKQTELNLEHKSTLQFVQDAESKARADLTHLEYQIKAFEEAETKFEESNLKLNKQLNLYTVNLDKDRSGLLLVQDELELVKESKQVIKSYLSCSFDSALESIGDAATRRIRRIPNMQTATIQLDGLKENQDGKVKEEVTAVVSMDGEIGISIKSLSGGERSSVDLAIDLSVIEFIELTTQKGISVFYLDEAFVGLDTANIVEAIEMLKESNSNKQIIIVDHNVIASQSIESKITVVRDGLTSKVVQ